MYQEGLCDDTLEVIYSSDFATKKKKKKKKKESEGKEKQEE